MRTRPFLAPASVVTLSLFAVTLASAHSLKDLEALLVAKEKYFQSLDKAAPDSALKELGGRSVRLSDLRGKVVVVYFTQVGGADACPPHSDRIAEIQSMVNQTPMKEQVQFVTITTDQGNNRSRVLRTLGEQHRLDATNWVLLTSDGEQSEDATRKLAAQFGHNVEQERECRPDGVITHVIDKEGRWRANFRSLHFEPTNLVVFINALVNDAHKPHSHGPQSAWDRIKKRLGF